MSDDSIDRAAEKLSQTMRASVSSPSAPLVAVGDNTETAQILLHVCMELSGTISEYRAMPCDSLQKRMFKTMDRYQSRIVTARNALAAQVSPQFSGISGELNSGQVAPQATVEPKFQELCDAMDSAPTEVKYQRAAEKLKDAVLGFASPSVQATVEPLTDERVAFEHFLMTECLCDLQELTLQANGEYDDTDIEASWGAWSARALLATPPTSKAIEPMADAYVGAREDLAIWKKRALEAEDSCRHLTAALNEESGPTFMGEPVATSKADTGSIPLRPTDDALWDDTLRDRDAYHHWADKLADAIAMHFNVDIGEHSNLNLPWAEALEAIENTEPDHGIEQAAQFIESKRDDYVNEHGIYDRDTGAMEYPGDGLDYVTQLDELVEEIRALKSATPSTIKEEIAPDKHPSALSIAGIARQHFGNPIPPAAYAFASELIAATLLTIKEEPKLMFGPQCCNSPEFCPQHAQGHCVQESTTPNSTGEKQ